MGLVWLGLVLSAVVFAVLLRGFDWRRFLDIIRESDLAYAAMVPAAITCEQVFRAVKWRELLRPFGRVSVKRLFGAIMAGYFANYLIPIRISFLVRALIASRAVAAPLSSTLGTVALGRVIDALVFVPIVVLAATTVAIGGDDGTITKRLLWGALISLLVLLALVALMVRWARSAQAGHGLPAALKRMLPARWHVPIEGLSASFAKGLDLPRSGLALVIIFGCALLMKLTAASHLAFAGLALSVDLLALNYLFIMVCLGFAVVIASTLKIVGGFIAGSIFLLQQFGVDVETATAMALLVSLSSRLTVIATGAVALWSERVDLAELVRLGTGARTAGEQASHPATPAVKSD